MPNAVSVQQVTHRYGEREALRGASFSVEEGALVGLLGPNGSGKTTLFRILSTLMPPGGGAARVVGFDVTREPQEVRRRLGVVFQHAALDDALSVRESLALHGALYGLRGKTLRARSDDLLRAFGLTDRTGDRVGTLSGGLKRRVDLVRGLLHAPQVLLLDEPTTGLDPTARRQFWDALDRLRREEGTTLLVATHLMDEAASCDEVVLLDAGEVVAQGAPGALTEAMGETALWLDPHEEPQPLADAIAARFGREAEVVGRRVRVSGDDAPALLGRLYDAFPGAIAAATVRRPTLEDVFLARTGRAFQREAEAGIEPVALSEAA